MTQMTPIEMQFSGKQFGWGESQDPLIHRYYKERLEAEKNEEEGLYSDIPELVIAKGEETPMESLVRSKMPFDDGWDFDVVDRLLFGHVPYVNQNPVGSCVGAGSASVVASKSAQEILIEGDPENPLGLSVDASGRNTSLEDCGIPFVGYHYGCGKTKSRWNGERFTGRGTCSDGSYCSAQIWALKTTGVIACSEVKDFRKGPQSDDVRSWGCNKRGELNNHLEFGLKHLMKNTTRVRSGDDLASAVCVLKQPCMVCSGWAFAPDHYVDGLGWVYKKRGSWAHNMSIVAVVEYKAQWYVKVRNQWGANAHKDGWHFWIELELADKWMKQAECQSIGELSLFPAESIPDFPY